jgi:hypothetical protein
MNDQIRELKGKKQNSDIKLLEEKRRVVKVMKAL